MFFVEVDGEHINMENVSSFRWVKGVLCIYYAGCITPARTKDPDRAIYRKLCLSVGVREVQEEKVNEQE